MERKGRKEERRKKWKEGTEEERRREGEVRNSTNKIQNPCVSSEVRELGNLCHEVILLSDFNGTNLKNFLSKEFSLILNGTFISSDSTYMLHTEESVYDSTYMLNTAREW